MKTIYDAIVEAKELRETELSCEALHDDATLASKLLLLDNEHAYKIVNITKDQVTESNEGLVDGGRKQLTALMAYLSQLANTMKKWAATALNAFSASDSSDLYDVVKATSKNTKVPEANIEKLVKHGLSFYAKYYLAAFRLPFNFKVKQFSMDRTLKTNVTRTGMHTAEGALDVTEALFNWDLYKIKGANLDLTGLNTTATFIKLYRAAASVYMVPAGNGEYAVLLVEKNGKSSITKLSVRKPQITKVPTIAELHIDLTAVADTLSLSKADRKKAIQEAYDNILVVNDKITAAVKMTTTEDTIGAAEAVRINILIRNQCQLASIGMFGVLKLYNNAVTIAETLRDI